MAHPLRSASGGAAPRACAAMSRAVKQPIGQKRLTNVAVVRFKTQGLRFEIACYRNTVLAWRSKIEKNLDNVLQSTTIYTNVSKGVLANKEDLLKVFGTTDEEKICVLERGELQVSDLERRSSAETLARDVVQVLVDKCVNPATGRPYTHGVLERALRTAHVALDPKRSAKQQALEALPKLQAQFPIERARMRFRLAAPVAAEAALRAALQEQAAALEGEETRGGMLVVTCTADPGSYRSFHAFTRAEACAGAGRLEVLSLAVADAAGSDAALDDAPQQQQLLPLPQFEQHDAPPPPLPREQPAQQQRRVQNRGSADALTADLANATLLGDAARDGGGGAVSEVVFSRAPIADLPEAHASRRERFAELDAMLPGWQVELRARPGSSVVDAMLFAPDGTAFKSFADARRSALKSRGAAA